jgi:hypothetical protein
MLCLSVGDDHHVFIYVPKKKKKKNFFCVFMFVALVLPTPRMRHGLIGRG